jgi:hypothetical protein
MKNKECSRKNDLNSSVTTAVFFLPSYPLRSAVAEFTSKWSLRKENNRSMTKSFVCADWCHCFWSLWLSFTTFLSHKHKRSFIDKGCELGILQPPWKKKKNRMTKGKGWGVEQGLRQLKTYIHSQTEKDIVSWKHFGNSTNVPPLIFLQTEPSSHDVINHGCYNPLLEAVAILLLSPPYVSSLHFNFSCSNHARCLLIQSSYFSLIWVRSINETKLHGFQN